MSKESDFCPKCAAPWAYDILTEGRHNDDLCVGRQLLNAQKLIKKLKADVAGWKEAWHQQRQLIGQLAWQGKTMPDKMKEKSND
jgi:hypothetical protein